MIQTLSVWTEFAYPLDSLIFEEPFPSKKREQLSVNFVCSIGCGRSCCPMMHED